MKKLRNAIRSSESLNSHSSMSFEQGVCTTGHPVSAEAGAWAIQQGGTAVDAMVAAAFASRSIITTVAPSSANRTAVDLPIPEPPPVIAATRPKSLFIARS